MGNELLKRAGKTSSGLWSAQFLIDSPELVKEVHQAYVDVGAQVITTNTYSTIPSYLKKEKKTHLMKDLIRKAGIIARGVAEENHQKILVAGSLPPLDESYRPDLVPDEKEALPIYEELIEELNPFVDIFLCETVSSILETSNILKAVKDKADKNKEIWLSWTLLEDKSGRLRSKETIEEAFQLAESFNPDAYLFNCTDPIAITEGIKKLSKLINKDLSKSYVRLEIIGDKKGFWLKPHKDISEKLMTMMIWANPYNESEKLGTDLYDKDYNIVKTVKYKQT